MVIASYGQIIPAIILNIPTKGCVNLHASLLPQYRGASPIQAAILNGDYKTGVTLMLMDEKMDHGPIISQISVTVPATDDYQSLHSKLSAAAAGLVEKSVPDWLAGKLQPVPQNHDAATYVKLITRKDARLDWTQPAVEILRKIRALNPEPGTWTTLDKKSVKIMGAEETKSGRIELPGKIYGDGKDCLVKCGDYSLKLKLIQPEGGKPMSGHEFLNGLKQLETKVFI
jgi:methionyl-tRNA formyltransferase